nr:MAG: hypothetical protein [Apis mellifera filamentous virus]
MRSTRGGGTSGTTGQLDRKKMDRKKMWSKTQKKH